MGEPHINSTRARWAAFGAAVAVTLGAGGLGIVRAAQPAGASVFVPITPCRLIDTRPPPDQVGPRSAPLGPNDTHTVSAHGSNGQCTGIPATATGLVLNVTAVGATEPTYLTIWPTGKSRPLASSLNPSPGQPPTPNGVTTALSPTGQFDIYNLQGNVQVLVDVTGYYTDHKHDAQIVYTGHAAQYFGAVTSSEHGCVRVTNDAMFAQLDLALPAGATITRVDVSYTAASNNGTPLELVLLRTNIVDGVRTDVPASASFLSFRTGGPKTGTLQLTGVGPVSPTSYYRLQIASSTTSGYLEFCGATVAYEGA